MHHPPASIRRSSVEHSRSYTSCRRSRIRETEESHNSRVSTCRRQQRQSFRTFPRGIRFRRHDRSRSLAWYRPPRYYQPRCFLRCFRWYLRCRSAHLRRRDRRLARLRRWHRPRLPSRRPRRRCCSSQPYHRGRRLRPYRLPCRSAKAQRRRRWLHPRARRTPSYRRRCRPSPGLRHCCPRTSRARGALVDFGGEDLLVGIRFGLFVSCQLEAEGRAGIWRGRCSRRAQSQREHERDLEAVAGSVGADSSHGLSVPEDAKVFLSARNVRAGAGISRGLCWRLQPHRHLYVAVGSVDWRVRESAATGENSTTSARAIADCWAKPHRVAKSYYSRAARAPLSSHPANAAGP
jgi:hypothetical protein